MNVVAVFDVASFAARCPTHVNTSVAAAAMVSLAWIVIVISLADVVDEMRSVAIAEPASVPVHTGACPASQIALCAPPAVPAVTVIVPLLPIAVVVVAFSTIFDGVSPIVVSSTSPSIPVIGVTESYVSATLGVTSTLETPVAEMVVTVGG